MLEFAKQLALRAGAVAMKDFAVANSHVSTKATGFDIVTETDRNVEKVIIEAITERFPDHGIYGEETGRSHSEREYCWIIDPIDGTASFEHRLPNWSVSIALWRNGQPLLGVVYAPVFRDLYYAEVGGGAWCNGIRLHVSERKTLAESIVGTGFSCLRACWREENNLPVFNQIAPQVRDIRKFGSAALDLAMVASGRLEAFWEYKLELYDVAAGVVLATEAGGRISDFRDGRNWPADGFLADNAQLHPVMLPFFAGYRGLHR